MIRTIRMLAALMLLVWAAPVAAQFREDSLSVRTFSLKSLSATDAAKLVAPYIRSSRGGVYDVAGARAITVRETPEVIKSIETILASFDRMPAVVRLNFQLITTTDTDTRDPAIAPVETALRGLFRFAGYKLLAQATSVVREFGDFQTTLIADDRRYLIGGSLPRVAVDSDGAIRISVSLNDITAPPVAVGQNPALPRGMWGEGRVLSTDLSAPLGQTVVLGSGAPERGGGVLILVVRAELAPQTGGR